MKSSSLIATWFGCGLSPIAPGTCGAAAALAIAIALHHYAGWTQLHFLLLTLALTPIGMWASGVYATSKGLKDPQSVVVDEVLGLWLTLVGAPGYGWKSWLAAFCLFRIFDIWKPFPIRRLEKVPGGIGIVADDLGAGVYGALVLAAAGWFNLI